jgi:5'-nucleotidase
MAWSPEDSLVIGISSRALFDLDEEDRVFRDEGTEAFIAYQQVHEDEIIKPGVAFPLVKELLGLNERLGTPPKPVIEIVILSKNHPDCAIRIRRSVEHHGLRLRRAVFTGGQDLLPHLRALQVDLFLSKEEAAVTAALENDISAGLIYGGPAKPEVLDGTPVLAFDGDAVLFSDQADRIYRQKQLPGFEESELQNARIPLPGGPLRRFAQALEELRAQYPIDAPPFRIALVTSRDFTYCERPMRTLRAWGIRIDQAFFVSDMSKGVELAALKPLIFFDDSPKHCEDASASTPTVMVPALETKITTVLASGQQQSNRPTQFLQVCKLFLKKTFDEHEPVLRQWREEHLDEVSEEAFVAIVEELERSAKGTPRGRQRRAAGAGNEDVTKLFSFLGNLLKKHTGQ